MLLGAGSATAWWPKRSRHPGQSCPFTRKQNVRSGLTAAFVRAGHFHKKLGLQLDAFPLSPPLAERLESCRIDRDFPKGPKPSDHAPLLAELRD